MFAAQLAGGLERVGPDVVDRTRRLPATLGLPTEVPGGEALDADELLAIMRRDKKSGGGLTFVLPGPNGIERVDDPDPAAVRKAFAAVGIGDVGSRWRRSCCSPVRT